MTDLALSSLKPVGDPLGRLAQVLGRKLHVTLRAWSGLGGIQFISMELCRERVSRC
jgi:hypothetical protein